MKRCPICAADYPDEHATCVTDGALLLSNSEWAPGSLIKGKYRIIGVIGRGGMGAVYKAEHIALEEIRALKVMAPALSTDQKFLRRFRQEAQVARRLLHPNAVHVDDLDQADDGSLFIAMDYVEGISLRELIRATKGPLPLLRTLGIIRGIANALEAAHAMGVVHRDIKPENILLAHDLYGRDIPKVADFGIVAMKESSANLSSRMLLTPEYASPEQWQGMRSNELDGRSDLYALGMTWYEMATGRLPFHSHTFEGWMRCHLDETPDPPSKRNPELTRYPGLDELVTQLVAKDREHRPADVDEFLQRLSLFEAQHAWHHISDSSLRGAGRVEAPDSASRRSAPASGPTRADGKPVGMLPAKREHVASHPANDFCASADEATTLQVSAISVATPPKPVRLPRIKKAAAIAAIGFAFVLLVVFAAIHSRRVAAWIAHGSTNSEAETESASKPGADALSPTAVPAPTGLSTPAQEIPVLSKVHSGTEAESSSNSTSLGNTNRSSMTNDSSRPGTERGMQPAAGGANPRQSGSAVDAKVWLYQKACDAGSAPTCNSLGLIYANGEGVPQDQLRAAGLYRQACDGGNPPGCTNLGYVYAHGLGVSADQSHALRLYQEGCSGGDAAGCEDLGFMYAHGRGVAIDQSRAVQFYQQGCDGGNPAGCTNLGFMYANGEGVARDPAHAVLLYQKGCEAGNTQGCTGLGFMYENGQGVTQDPNAALRLFQKACDKGETNACEHLKSVQHNKSQN